MEINKIC